MNCGRNRSTGTLWIINGICFALRLKGRDVGVVHAVPRGIGSDTEIA